jgi:Mg2+ and Co2+ transporter CorA
MNYRLTDRNAAALADQAGDVYRRAADIARAAAEMVASLSDEAGRLAAGAGDDERAAFSAAADTVEIMALRARVAVVRADLASDRAANGGVLARAAEDIEPEAIAEIALHLAESLAAALEAIARTV